MGSDTSRRVTFTTKCRDTGDGCEVPFRPRTPQLRRFFFLFFCGAHTNFEFCQEQRDSILSISRKVQQRNAQLEFTSNSIQVAEVPVKFHSFGKFTSTPDYYLFPLFIFENCVAFVNPFRVSQVSRANSFPEKSLDLGKHASLLPAEGESREK